MNQINYHNNYSGGAFLDRETIERSLEIVQLAAVAMLAKNEHGFAYLTMETRGIALDVILGSQKAANDNPKILEQYKKIADWGLEKTREYRKSTSEILYNYANCYKVNDFMRIGSSIDVERDIIVSVFGCDGIGFVDEILSEMTILWVKKFCNLKARFSCLQNFNNNFGQIR